MGLDFYYCFFIFNFPETFELYTLREFYNTFVAGRFAEFCESYSFCPRFLVVFGDLNETICAVKWCSRSLQS